MSSASLRSEACSRILARREDAEGRFADLQASLVYRPKRKGRQAHWLFTAGGLWDTREHCYVQDPDDPALLALAETELSLTIHEGQLEAAEW
ncbi:MAG: hypothetical protein MJE77_12260, partial [Proteobacteria bacterium]|nr:hypothetical protein [Pseudomonadota bacterium]